MNSAPFIQEVSGAYTFPLLDTDELQMALRARKVFGALEKRAPALISGSLQLFASFSVLPMTTATHIRAHL